MAGSKTLCVVQVVLVLWSSVVLASSPQCDGATVKADPAGAVNACAGVLARTDIALDERIFALKIEGQALYRQRFFDNAVKVFDEGLKLVPTDAELLVQRGWLAFEKNEFEKALELAHWGIKQSPNYAEGYALIAAVKQWKHEDFSEAQKAIDTAIRLDPLGSRYAQRSGVYQEWALYPEAMMALDDALRAADDTIDLEPTILMGVSMPRRADLMIRKGWLFDLMGKLDEAEAAFDQFVQRSPGAIAYTFRAAYHLDHSNFEKAQADLDAASTYRPDFWFFDRTQGQVFLYEKKYPEAIASLTHFTKQTGFSADILWWRAMAWRGLGHNDEATKDALAAFTDFGFARRKVKKLAELGYYQPPEPGQELAALQEAVRACILDESCR